MMQKSRTGIRRRTRLGWLLALFVLVMPAPVIAGVQWTMQSRDPAGVEWTQLDAGRLSRGDHSVDRTLTFVAARSGDARELRGSEWT